MTKVTIGTKQMAQFGYEGAKLSSDINEFTVGTYIKRQPSLIEERFIKYQRQRPLSFAIYLRYNMLSS